MFMTPSFGMRESYKPNNGLNTGGALTKLSVSANGAGRIETRH